MNNKNQRALWQQIATRIVPKEISLLLITKVYPIYFNEQKWYLIVEDIGTQVLLEYKSPQLLDIFEDFFNVRPNFHIFINPANFPISTLSNTINTCITTETKNITYEKYVSDFSEEMFQQLISQFNGYSSSSFSFQKWKLII